MAPETNVATEVLRTLHRIQRQLTDLNERLARGPRLARAHDANLKRLQTDLEETRNEARQLRIANDEKQLQLASGEEAVKKRQLQLRQAGDNREYQALKDQIAADEMTNSVLADEILEGMDKLDQLNQRVAEAEAALEKAKQEADKSRQKTEQEGPLIQADRERLQAELRRSETDLPGDFRQHYLRLVRQRGEDALAAVEGEYCGGCNQQVPVNMINDMMLGRPTSCRACGRMLYLPEGYQPSRRSTSRP